MNGLSYCIKEVMAHNRNGNTVLLPVQEKNIDRVFAGTEDVGAEIRFTEKENLTAVHVSCQYYVKAPKFGYQSFLNAECGLSFQMIFEEDSPFMSIYQHKEWWIRPYFGKRFCDIPANSQLVISKREDKYLVMLAVSGETCRTDISGADNGIQVSVGSGQSSRMNLSDLTLILGEGEDPYELTEQAAAYALELTGKRLELRKEKKFPEIFEKIGWCTWDSLGQDVSEKAVLDKMDEFQEKEIPVSWVLIDDGWSKVNRVTMELQGFDAEEATFPNGIGHTARILKEKYGVENVGVWQAVKGYWNGVEQSSEAAYKTSSYLMSYPNGEMTVRPDAAAVFGFWNMWHSYLKKQGIDFIKVDSQSSFSIMSKGFGTYGDVLSEIHTGLDASADLHFGGNMINCMGMAPENVWNRHSSALSRSSDDFTPTVKGSFGEHALQNGYNSVYHGCFYWGDWDMVWSKHEDVKPNMILRLMSGGPVYLSDGCGTSVKEEIMPLILDDATLLRCQDVGRPTLDCLLDGGVLSEHPLKLYNHYEEVYYIASYSYTEEKDSIDGYVSWKDMPGKSAEKYWIFDWYTRTAYLKEAAEKLEISMGKKDAGLYHLISAKEGVAVLGVLDKYISRAAAEVLYKDEANVFVKVKCAGTFAFLSEKEIAVIEMNGAATECKKNGYLYTVDCDQAGAVIKITL